MGSGSERTAEASVFSGISFPPEASTHFSTDSHTVTELVRPRQRRENSKGSELWRHLWTLHGPQSGIRRGEKQGQLRDLS